MNHIHPKLATADNQAKWLTSLLNALESQLRKHETKGAQFAAEQTTDLMQCIVDRTASLNRTIAELTLTHQSNKELKTCFTTSSSSSGSSPAAAQYSSPATQTSPTSPQPRTASGAKPPTQKSTESESGSAGSTSTENTTSPSAKPSPTPSPPAPET